MVTGPKSKKANASLKYWPWVYGQATFRRDRVAQINRTLGQRIEGRIDLLANNFFAILAQTFYSSYYNRWDARQAAMRRTVPALTEEAQAQLALVQDDLNGELTDAVQRSRRDGYTMALWDLYAAGVIDDEDLQQADVPDDEERTLEYLTAATIGGLTLTDRLNRWFGDSNLKTSMFLKGTVLGEQTLKDTELGLDRLYEQLAGRVSVLGFSEVQRGFYDGQLAALEAALGEDFSDLIVGELWLTRQDAQVCPICAALNNTVTQLQPIDDTHPNCRCVKVPLLNWEKLGDTLPRALSFPAFEALMGLAS